MALIIDKNLMIRIVTALLALPVVLGPVYAGGVFFLILILLATLIMLDEWLRMIKVFSFAAIAVSCTLLAVLTVLLFVLVNKVGSSIPEQTSAIISLGLFFGIISAFFWKRSVPKPLFVALGLVYTGLAAGSLFYLRSLENGSMLLVWLLFTVWAADVGGYFAGKAIGGAKLAPSISPNKTWAGFLGGIVLAVVIGMAVSLIFDWWHPELAAIGSGIAALIAQVGDLYESRLKRLFDIKDSGGIMPGHGGLLDRVDGLVFAVIAAAILMAFGHPGR